MKKAVGVLAAIITILSGFDSAIKFLENRHHIALSNDGSISVLFLADNIWYIRALIVLSVGVLVYLAVKSVFDSESYTYALRMLFFMWLSVVLMIVHQLATPVTWYGLVFGLSLIITLFSMLHHAWFPKLKS
jgi:hypothetical protein